MYTCTYSMFIAYVAFMVHVCTRWGVHREICSMQVRAQSRCAAKHSMQCINDLALHRSHCALTTAAAMQGLSTMTKITKS